MTHSFDSTGAALAPGITAAGSRPAGGTGPGVPLCIWPGLPDRRIRDGLPFHVRRQG
jgi:hypothetical protein